MICNAPINGVRAFTGAIDICHIFLSKNPYPGIVKFIYLLINLPLWTKKYCIVFSKNIEQPQVWEKFIFNSVTLPALPLLLRSRNLSEKCFIPQPEFCSQLLIKYLHNQGIVRPIVLVGFLTNLFAFGLNYLIIIHMELGFR